MRGQASMRVLLVEDQQLIRRGLAMLLSTVGGVEVVAQAEDGRTALAALATTEVDVVLTDARMPGIDGVELTARCARERPELPVLVLTTFDDDALVQSALAAGAAGFLLKDTSVEGLTAALRAVIDGGMVIDPRVTRAAMRPQDAGDGPLAILTQSESLVAELVAKGLTNQEIAASLVLAEGTVKNHVSALLRKLAERDRTALALTLYKALGD
ncbi:response regulator transcription factor [Oerskovia turbata]